jgi:hypothetical protein
VLAHAPYQLDYITFKTGAVSINGLDVERYEKDSSFIANTIKIADPVLTVYRDKKPPVSPIKKAKPLPVDMIKRIPFPVLIEAVQIEDGTITYNEKNGSSRKEGQILLSNVSGTFENIKNSNLQDGDTLTLRLNSRLMDSASITLNLKESYTDTLSGFLLNGKISSADLSILNPFLVPLSNIKITSGILDSIVFQSLGRKDVSLGRMNMHYRKLRIKQIKDGDPNISTFKQKVISVLANTFVIRSNNSKRTGIIYLQRYGHKSFVNFIVHSTMSGIMSSIGVRKNEKYIKQYKQQLKDSNLQPVKL